MVLTDLTVRDYAQKLASDAPAPGGGSAAALVGALGVALGEMVGNFTVGKEKFADVEEEVAAALDRLTELRNRLLDLTNEDATAYSQVGEAYGMPKDTDEQKQQRRQAIQQALQAAADVPAQVIHCCHEAVGELPVLLEKGNQNLVSDVGVAAKLAIAAADCAWLNVEINCAYMKDEEYIAQLRSSLQEPLDAIRTRGSNIWDETVSRVRA